MKTLIIVVTTFLVSLGLHPHAGRSREDQCSACAGFNATSRCHLISGIFTRRGLPYGYSKVATIPAGACSINITEMFATRNYIAVKLTSGPYIFNGEWKLQKSGDYPGAGSILKYYVIRQDSYVNGKETVFAKGPTNESIDIMLLKQHTNLGVMYEYIMPMETSSEPPHSDVDTKPFNTSSESVYTQGTAVPAGLQSPVALQRADSEISADKASGVLYATGSRLLTSDTQPGRRIPSSDTHTGSRPLASDSRALAVPSTGVQTSADVSGFSYASSDTNSRRYNRDTGHRLRHSGRHGRNALSQNPYAVQSISPAQHAYAPQPPITAGGNPSQPYRPNSPNPQQPYRLNSPNTPQSYRPNSPYPLYNSQVYPSPINRPLSYPLSSNPGSGVHSLGYNNYAALSAPQSLPYPYNYLPAQSRVPDDQGVRTSANWISAQSRRNSEPHNDYSWRISGFTDCSLTCGGGVQTTIIICVKGGTLAVVTNENCDKSLKPKLQTITCNNSPCPPEWVPEPWGNCSTSCDPGTQSRDIACKQRVSDVVTMTLSGSKCHDARPPTRQRCNLDKPCVSWHLGEWSKCSVKCDRGQRTREVVCMNLDNRTVPYNHCREEQPANAEVCDMGSCAETWFHTRWSQQCSTECGEGWYHRGTFCAAEPERCENLGRPSAYKRCHNDIPCGGKWFSGPWGECSATCGSGVISRDVICMKELGRRLTIVADENCDSSVKPEAETPCEKAACVPEWYMTEWLECSRSCDGGQRKRGVKCLDPYQRASTDCSDERKPSLWQECNEHPCPPQGDQADSGCLDKFKNCGLVVQAGLCDYSYYQISCCQSCAGH